MKNLVERIRYTVSKGSGMLIILVVLSAIPVFAFSQHKGEGIRLKEERAKTRVYEIRVEGVKSQEQSSVLIYHMESRENIVSATMDLQTGICEVETLLNINVSDLQDVVEYSGFNVAKSFDQ